MAPFVLAKDEVVFVGEAVAIVIAQSRAIAEDAAALVEVDYEPLPAISDCRAALRPGAPLAHRRKSSNLLIEFRQAYGDAAAAFARAPHRVGVSLKQHRGGAHSMEGRGAVAVYDANEDRLTLVVVDAACPRGAGISDAARFASTRIEFASWRRMSAAASAASSCFIPRKSRLRPPACGCAVRSNGSKTAASIFARRVQERDQYWDLEAAFDGEGRVLGVRGELIHDQGAYTPQGLNLPYNTSTGVPGPYIVPAYELRVRVVETNKVATMPVRGAGYPEAAFAMERAARRHRARAETRSRRGAAAQSRAGGKNALRHAAEDALRLAGRL